MLMTGKRHDFLADYTVGFDASGRILALTVMLASRCGYSADLSGPVNDRAMMHIDNAYFLENVDIVSHRCKTHTVSNTAFRGFGGPQGMVVIEQIIDSIARALGMDPLEVRRRNFYGIDDRNVTHYGQTVEHNLIHTIVERLAQSSHYLERRKQVAEWNDTHRHIKRGLALTPVKFGISFTATMFNQAGALIHVYTDGTVLLNHGGTEMGQGLVHEGRAGGCDGVRTAAHGGSRVGDRHFESTEHLRQRRVRECGPQREGGAGRGRNHPRAVGAIRLRDFRRRQRRRLFFATARFSSASGICRLRTS